MSSKLTKSSLIDKFPNIIYKKNFSGGILKYSDGCLLIFLSGRLVVTGIKNIESANTLLNRFTLNYPGFVHVLDKRIVNIVSYNRIASMDGNLFKKLAYDVRNSYEPELFPAVHIKVDDSKAIFIVFRTGTITLTGVKDLELISHYFAKFESIYNGPK